ncbi:cation-translocating P-type ATPase [Maricaulis sp.]|uniref:cation-translocating P-type ATPase n=1 Tax=Maricaulis sp. TaxID=1486257 RepID=UPI003A8CEA6D
MTSPLPKTSTADSTVASPEARAWHALPPDEAAKLLHSDAESGLSAEEAARRLERYGPNAFEARETLRWPVMLARQFKDVLIIILLAAAAVSAALGDPVDAVAILAIVSLNAALGFFQEYRAERALAALKRLLAPSCRVIRDGVSRQMDASQLVPGDLVRLQPGDHTPADLRLVEARDLAIDESALTGESHAADKLPASVEEDAAIAERRSIAYAGGLVVRGRATGLVTATGYATQFGRIALLATSIDRDITPLQKRLARLGARLGMIAAAVAAVLALSGFLLGRDALEMFLTGVALAVAMVPEGLPAVVTLTLALGVRAMARRNALVRRLPAAETLGAATIICSDKTGTLTHGEMAVTQVWTPQDGDGPGVGIGGAGYEPSGAFKAHGHIIDPDNHPGLMALLEAGLICNHARVFERDGLWRLDGEPTEGALVTAALKAGLDRPSTAHAREIPFSSARKRMSLIIPAGDCAKVYLKGAPEEVLARCSSVFDGGADVPLDADGVQDLHRVFEGMAERGLRVLAVARKTTADPHAPDAEIERDLTFLGFFGVMDPPREEVPTAIARAHTAGLRVVMITGDAPATALAVAHSIGLDARSALTGVELDAMQDAALLRAIHDGAVFSRVAPEHKLRLVEILQRDGEIVAMTGDGVNDAPALKRADIGVAMGIRGTDAAKDAAEMVLMDDNFATIIGAVEEGRRQYANIRKFVRYLLSSNMAELIAIGAALLMGWPLILLPVQVLWMNLVTDGPTALALGIERADRDLMRHPPAAADAAVVSRGGLVVVILLASYMGLASLWLFQDALARGESLLYAQTLVFTGLIVFEKTNVLNFRSLDRPLALIGLFSNPWLLLAIAVSIALQLGAVYWPPLQLVLHSVPLDGAAWQRILLLAVPILLVPELVKGLGVFVTARAAMNKTP